MRSDLAIAENESSILTKLQLEKQK